MPHEQAIRIQVPDADIALEARVLDQSEEKTEVSRIGLVMCHPHPLFGGTMDNKVVTTVARAARDLGMSTLRFNFRGVGESSGNHDNGVGEVDDVAAVVEYARSTLGWSRIMLCGFSFGAGMACLYADRAAQAATTQDAIQGLTLIAPAVHHFDAPSVLPPGLDTWVLMGNEDEVVPFEEVDDWVQRLVPMPHWLVFNEAGHFFHGRTTDLKASIMEEWQAWQHA